MHIFSRLKSPDVLTVSLWVIIIGGAIVRYVGLDFGLPLTVQSDEGTTVDAAIGMVERRSFEPDRFQWPNHLGAMGTYLALVFITPLVHGMLVEQAINEIEIGYFFLVGRFVTATFGVISIVLAYFIGKRFNRSIGVFAAAFIAFFPQYVQHSHYATPDVGLTAAVLAAILAGMVYIDKPTFGNMLVMSATSAVAILAKYPGALTTSIIAAAIIATAIRDKQWTRIFSHGAPSVFFVGLFLFILSPVLFTHRAQVINSLSNESRGTHLGADGMNFPEKLEFYASHFLNVGGVLLVLFAVAGLWYLVRNPRLAAIPLGIGIVFWVALSTLGLQWNRWALPMYVTPLLLAAIGAYFILEAARTRWQSRRAVKAVAAGVVGLVLLTQVVGSVAASAVFLRDDTRVLALNDFEARGITEENTAYEGYTPFRPRHFDTVFDEIGEWDGRLIPIDPEVSYVLLSSSMFGRFQREADRYVDENRFYDMLDEQYELLEVIQSYNPRFSLPFSNFRLVGHVASIANTALGAETGPTMRLYKVPSDIRTN